MTHPADSHLAGNCCLVARFSYGSGCSVLLHSIARPSVQTRVTRVTGNPSQRHQERREITQLGTVRGALLHERFYLVKCFCKKCHFFAIFLIQPTLPVSEKLLLTGHVHKIPAARWKKNSYLLSPRHSVTGIKAPLPPLSVLLGGGGGGFFYWRERKLRRYRGNASV